MRFNAAKSFNSMLKYAQQYTVNIYMEKGILWIHWMLEIMREDSKQRIAQEKKKKELLKIKQNKRTPRYILVKLVFQCRNCTIFFEL